MNNNIKSIIVILIVFFIANGVVFQLTTVNKADRINAVLEKNIKNLETHYNLLINYQTKSANAVYKTIIQFHPRIIKILIKAQNATTEERKVLREELYKFLEKRYKIMKFKGVHQVHFVLPNNKTFLRMHKSNKYDDDLSIIRKDMAQVNREKKIVRGFMQGKTSHAFRNLYPIFDKNRYLGLLDVGFSSENIQDNLIDVSGIHTHFIINKSVFKTKVWKREDLSLKYKPSYEHKDYMVLLSKKTKIQLLINF